MTNPVKDYFWTYNADLEGICDFPYLDVKGLLTTGVGNRIYSDEFAYSLDWIVSGQKVTRERVKRELELVRARIDLCLKGGFAYKRLTSIRLSKESLENLFYTRFDWHEKVLSGRIPGWKALPLDVQLGVHSIAWASGPLFRFPVFLTCLRERNFLCCAKEGHLDEDGPDNIVGTKDDNPGVKPRNKKQEICFNNGHWIVEKSLDPKTLWFPKVLTKEDIGAICQQCHGLGRI